MVCHQMGQAAGRTYVGNGEFSSFALAKVAGGCQVKTALQQVLDSDPVSLQVTVGLVGDGSKFSLGLKAVS